eukprot:4299625-Amphidinium_carterae.1
MNIKHETAPFPKLCEWPTACCKNVKGGPSTEVMKLSEASRTTNPGYGSVCSLSSQHMIKLKVLIEA